MEDILLPDVIITILLISLYYGLIRFAVKYADEPLCPDKEHFTDFTFVDNALTISSTKSISNKKYKITFKSNFNIKKDDNLKISYNMDLGKITKIRAIYVNDILLIGGYKLEKEAELSIIL